MSVITAILMLTVLYFSPGYNQKTKKEIMPLKGTAPYGVEKRPMPSGLNIDELLPTQVGPYKRVLLEESENRGVTPSSIQVDGPSIYATYKSGPKEVFIEFAICSDPASAQEILVTAAGDTSGGKFPTDPRFGSLGTEPSYLRVNTNKSGSFYAWTRGTYYFSASAKGGVADLDAFMRSFPY